MKKILILEKTGEELVSAGYTKCTQERYNQYKADTTNYQTAISDDGKFYFKKKTESPPPPPTEPKDDSGKKDEKPYLKVKLPFKTTPESDAFRAWLRKNYPDYGDVTKMKSLSVDKPPSKFMTSGALKNAYYDKGTEYEKWVAGGGKVDPTTFEVNDGTYVPPVNPGQSTNLTSQQQTIVKMKGCKSVGTKSRFKELSQDNDELNDLVNDFISWYKKFTGKTYFVKTGTCGIYPESPSLWVYGTLYDENGDEYQSWQSSIINDLTKLPVELSDGTKATYFDVWVKNRKERLDKYKKKLESELQTSTSNNLLGSSQSTTTTTTKSDLERASEVVLGFTTKQTCKNLKGYLKGYDNSNPEINKAIEKCKDEYPKLMKESLQDKITSKLTMMKENKTQNNVLNEKVTEKLKMKKLEKISENFFKQNYRKFFDSYSQYMKSNKMISESSNAEFEKSFDTIFKGKEEEFKKRAIDYVITKLEVNPTSPLATEIRNELSKKSAKELFTNEYDIPDAVTTAIEKTNQQSSSDDTGLKGIVSKSVKIDDKQVKQEVRKHLEKYVDEVKTNISSLDQKIKTAVVQGI